MVSAIGTAMVGGNGLGSRRIFGTVPKFEKYTRTGKHQPRRGWPLGVGAYRLGLGGDFALKFFNLCK